MIYIIAFSLLWEGEKIMTDGKHPCKHARTGYIDGLTRYVCALTNNSCCAQYYCDAVRLWKPSTNVSKCQNFTPEESETDTAIASEKQ